MGMSWCVSVCVRVYVCARAVVREVAGRCACTCVFAECVWETLRCCYHLINSSGTGRVLRSVQRTGTFSRFMASCWWRKPSHPRHLTWLSASSSRSLHRCVCTRAHTHKNNNNSSCRIRWRVSRAILIMIPLAMCAAACVE